MDKKDNRTSFIEALDLMAQEIAIMEDIESDSDDSDYYPSDSEEESEEESDMDYDIETCEEFIKQININST